MNDKDGVRPHDHPTPQRLLEFLKTGWSPSPLSDLSQAEVSTFAAARREKLSSTYRGIRLILPAGPSKVRSNDTDYRYRAHTAFAYYTGLTSSDTVPDSVLVLEPTDAGHDAYLFVHPRDDRNSEGFFRNAAHGEFWIGRRMTLDEVSKKYALATRDIKTIEEFLSDEKDALIIRGVDKAIDKLVERHKKREAEFESTVSAQRVIKDAFEIAEMQKAIDATNRGFGDVVHSMKAAIGDPRGERIIEGAFAGRARLEGYDVGYNTIAAAGAHACILHWTRNDGAIVDGELLLLDAGVEMDSLYTADVTRTLPINGTFTEAQRDIYTLVYEAQKAGIAAVKPGASFRDFHLAAQRVLAEGLERLGILNISADESMNPDAQLHRRWTIHSTGHMLGMDVHDCAQARNEQNRDAILEAGMILTVEPGVYLHPDDEYVPAKYRGIGVRIEDDILVTPTGNRNLSGALPSHPDEVEVWMSNLSRG